MAVTRCSMEDARSRPVLEAPNLLSLGQGAGWFLRVHLGSLQELRIGHFKRGDILPFPLAPHHYATSFPSLTSSDTKIIHGYDENSWLASLDHGLLTTQILTLRATTEIQNESRLLAKCFQRLETADFALAGRRINTLYATHWSRIWRTAMRNFFAASPLSEASEHDLYGLKSPWYPMSFASMHIAGNARVIQGNVGRLEMCLRYFVTSVVNFITINVGNVVENVSEVDIQTDYERVWLTIRPLLYAAAAMIMVQHQATMSRFVNSQSRAAVPGPPVLYLPRHAMVSQTRNLLTRPLLTVCRRVWRLR